MGSVDNSTENMLPHVFSQCAIGVVCSMCRMLDINCIVLVRQC